MSHQTKAFIFFTAIAVAIVTLVVLYAKRSMKEQRDKHVLLLSLKAEYDQALRDGDKPKSLELGRKYYSALRNGKLTMNKL